MDIQGIVTRRSENGVQLDKTGSDWYSSSKFAKYENPFSTIKVGDLISMNINERNGGRWIENFEVLEQGAGSTEPTPSVAQTRSSAQPTKTSQVYVNADSERTRSILKQVAAKNAATLFSAVVAQSKTQAEAKSLALEFSTRLETYIMDPKIETLSTVFADEAHTNGNGNGVKKNGRKAVRSAN